LLAANDSLTYNSCVTNAQEYAFDFLSHSAKETRDIGNRLGRLLVPGDLICLQGELGAGKTTLVQGLAQGWGSQDEVTSPTFVLVNEYRRPNRARLFHMDAYRLESEREAEELDVDRMLTEGALIVEWPERVRSALPAGELRVHLEFVTEKHRQLKFQANGGRFERMLEELQRSALGVV
jgi:tRNA threonylcarbamoyladenosine biosynthesis protein TsaE